MDAVDEWPEPIVPVQSLSATGVASIPLSYIKPPHQRPSPAAPRNTTLRIPVIDVSQILTSATPDPSSVTSVVGSIDDACRNWGFFYAVNHGIPEDLIDRFLSAWRAFFTLPTEEKLRHANNPKTYEGYGSRLGVDLKDALDWNDYYFLQVLPAAARNMDKWPSHPASLHHVLEDYTARAAALFRALLGAMSLGLGLPKERLNGALGGEGHGASLRVNYYPPCPQPDMTLGVSPHSDPCAVTVLLQDPTVTGLEIAKAGEWVSVGHMPGALIINLGDQIQVLSNAIYRSVEHRVVVNSSRERISMALFFNPEPGLPVGPCSELVRDGEEPMYSTMTFEDYRLHIRTKGLGRAGKYLKDP